jgi:hypothetical protein
MDRSTAAVRLLAGDKEPVRLATTENVPLVGLTAIDGVTTEAGDRVLVKDQTDATQNGIYTASVGTWRRAPDSATSRSLVQGMKVAVQEGTTHAGDVWNLLTDRPNIGTDDIAWSFYLSSTTIQQINDAAEGALASIEQSADAFAHAADDILATAWAATNAADFASYVAAQLVQIPAGMNYFRTAGYTTAGDGGGELYRYNGTTAGDIVMTRDDGVTLAGFDVGGKVVNAASFGLSASKTAIQNMAILKAAIARTATNGRLIIPDLGSAIPINTAGGLNQAATIDRKMTVQIDGWLKASYSAYEANPAYIFNVKAHSVVFEGAGTIEGDGSFHIGGSTTLNMPGLIFADSVNNFRFRGIRILRPPQVGIMLAVCNRAIIRDCEMSGGPTSFEMSFVPPLYTVENPNYNGSAHFGVVATGGGDHTFSKIHFTKDEFNGRNINCIFPSGVYGNSNGNKTLHCIAYGPYEKLLYGYGDNQLIAGNTVFGSGADRTDTHTEAIRVWGSNARVYGNFTFGCRSGMQLLDGARNKVFGNHFLRCQSSGVNVQHFSDDYTGGIDGNVIRDNYISRDGSSAERRFGVRILGNSLMDLSLCEVSDNTFVGWGDEVDEIEYTIDVLATTPRVAYKCSVKNNKLQSCGNGIRLTRAVAGHVDSNDFHECTSIAIHIQAGARNIVESNTGENPGTYFLSYSAGGNEPTGSVFRNNYCTGASNIAIRNHAFNAANIWAEGNQWTNKPLVGAATLTAGAGSSTIVHGGVAPHASIMLTNTTQQAAAKEAAVGFYASIATNDLAVATGDGSNFGDGVGIRYQVVQ